MKFRDRTEAGAVLAGMLGAYAGRPDVVVLGLPRSGVLVAAEVAAALQAPLDVFVVRKLGVPGREELALGAIASGGIRVLNDDLVRGLRTSPETLEEIAQREQTELERRETLYRGARPALELKGKTVVLVDDGLATGASMRAAVLAVRHQRPAAVVVAVPTASPQAAREMARIADEVVCAAVPDPFWGVGAWYDDFRQATDADVTRILRQSREAAGDLG